MVLAPGAGSGWGSGGSPAARARHPADTKAASAIRICPSLRDGSIAPSHGAEPAPPPESYTAMAARGNVLLQGRAAAPSASRSRNLPLLLGGTLLKNDQERRERTAELGSACAGIFSAWARRSTCTPSLARRDGPVHGDDAQSATGSGLPAEPVDLIAEGRRRRSVMRSIRRIRIVVVDRVTNGRSRAGGERSMKTSRAGEETGGPSILGVDGHFPYPFLF